MWHLYIGGITPEHDRKRDWLAGTMRIGQELTYLIDTAEFNITGARPINGSTVRIEDDDPTVGVLFAGIIKCTKLAYESQDHSVQEWRVECVDYTDQLDKRLVTEEYIKLPANEIFLDIIKKYCRGFNVDGIRSNAPTVDYISFDHLRPSECFKKICEYVGWEWQPDYNKNLQFYNAQKERYTAPLELVPNGEFYEFVPTVDETGLVNSVDVLGGTMLSDPIDVEFVHDGKMRVWTIPYKPHELKIFVGGAQKTVGIENIDKADTVDFLVNFQEQRITMGKNMACPPEGTTIRQNLRYDVQVITRVEDMTSQAQVRAVQGGDGIYEHCIIDNSLTTFQATEAAGNAYLAEHSNPKVTGTFTTSVPGWQSGQIVKVNLPVRGIVGEYKVQAVEITRDNQMIGWKYRVTFGGRLKGVADVLTALVSKQQQQDTQPGILNKFKYKVESVIITDSFFTKTHSGYWICNDSDAISDLVVVG